MNWKLITTIVLFTMNAMVILLHAIGLYLLLTHRVGRSKQIILINLAIVDILFAILWILHLACELLNIPIVDYLVILKGATGLVLYYILSLLCIDRVLEVYLHLNYATSLIYTHKTAFAFFGWVIGGAGLVILELGKAFAHWEVTLTIHRYIYMGGDVLVLLTALPAYVYLYQKYRESNSKMAKFSLNNRIKSRGQGFLIPYMIILSFFCFFVIPDIVVIALGGSTEHQHLLNIVNKLNFLADAVVYIFLQTSLRKRVLRYVTFRCCTTRKEDIEIPRRKYGIHQMIIKK